MDGWQVSGQCQIKANYMRTAWVAMRTVMTPKSTRKNHIVQTVCYESLRSSEHARLFFFFQAEDGIRDLTVTGVQTCALPIFPLCAQGGQHIRRHRVDLDVRTSFAQFQGAGSCIGDHSKARSLDFGLLSPVKIGRASCRERV